MSRVSDSSNSIVQRSGQSVVWTNTRSLNRFQINVQTDIASIINQLNTVYLPLVSNLVGETDSRDIDVLDIGLSGNTLYTDVNATSGSNSYLFDTVTGRKLSIKESIDAIATSIDIINNGQLGSDHGTSSLTAEEGSALQSAVDTVGVNLIQVKNDVFGGNYSLSGDGVPFQSYPLAQFIDAIGSFFSGMPSTGNTYENTFPSLNFTVNSSDLVFDSTIDSSNITDLDTNLASIRTFVGMDSVGSTTEYSAHGSIVYVADGDSLELAIQTLDSSLASLVSETILYRTAFTDASYYTLTTDGGAPTSSNILTLPVHSSAWLTIDWVILYSNGSTQRTAGGTMVSLARRVAGSVTVVDYSNTEFKDSAATNNTITIATAATVAAPKVIASGTGIEFQIALTTGSGTPTKAMARVKMTTVTNTGV